jgi:hypothetical protein
MSDKIELSPEYFTAEDAEGDMTLDEFQEAVTGLVQKGLMEEIMVDGVKFYRASPLLESIRGHFESNPKERN